MSVVMSLLVYQSATIAWLLSMDWMLLTLAKSSFTYHFKAAPLVWGQTWLKIWTFRQLDGRRLLTSINCIHYLCRINERMPTFFLEILTWKPIIHTRIETRIRLLQRINYFTFIYPNIEMGQIQKLFLRSNIAAQIPVAHAFHPWKNPIYLRLRPLPGILNDISEGMKIEMLELGILAPFTPALGFPTVLLLKMVNSWKPVRIISFSIERTELDSLNFHRLDEISNDWDLFSISHDIIGSQFNCRYKLSEYGEDSISYTLTFGICTFELIPLEMIITIETFGWI